MKRSGIGRNMRWGRVVFLYPPSSLGQALGEPLLVVQIAGAGSSPFSLLNRCGKGLALCSSPFRFKAPSLSVPALKRGMEILRAHRGDSTFQWEATPSHFYYFFFTLENFIHIYRLHSRKLAWPYLPSLQVSASCLIAQISLIEFPCLLCSPNFVNYSWRTVFWVSLGHEQLWDITCFAFHTASRRFWEHQECLRERGLCS